ncbi:cardiolipin synthase [Aerococcus urinaehominis]|uniref:Cardiolipin synthase n=1 Tax=Aerococcus urinaehominis TaxID=128944 RepID=A0A120IAS5_9LACT|nr:cardiolipin synthase [Aerococcus urinaehominis]AMB98981.1 cardiolipin synthase [Aerococcus urinaehominis]SDM37771.1 cardiolipin synthase [Aerococcus urinaehominis]
MAQYIYIGIMLLALVNTAVAIYTVFKEPRQISAIWAWLMVLILLPGLGFIIYYFLGRRISSERIFQLKNTEALGMMVHKDHFLDDHGNMRSLYKYEAGERELIKLLFQSDASILTDHNEVEVITDGYEKFDRLKADLRKAQHHIHIQYYIFEDDEVGKEILQILEEKARAGVEVRMLYDALGSRNLREKDLQDLRDAGGKTANFFGANNWIINFRLNYRNHRKIVVVDGEVGYIGGFNVAKEYIGKGPLGNWRDTHLRVTGNVVQALQSRFIIDWSATIKEASSDELIARYEPYFKEESDQGDTPMQIVSSGPDQTDEQIKMGYLKMISMAEKNVYIQSPYFIPDDSVYEAIKMAALSGVKIHIMFPCQPDHPFVYRASEYYLKELLDYGVHVYTYDDGFLHAKVTTVDDKVASVGTANYDIRSFRLNFEVNAFIYDEAVTQELNSRFHRDLEKSSQLDHDYFANQSNWTKFKQHFSRLLSPIL